MANIHDLKLHEEIKITGDETTADDKIYDDEVYDVYVRRVPGGWLYTQVDPTLVTTMVFVPYSDEFKTWEYEEGEK